ncbi:MAG: Sec translocon subunit SecE [Candidatus Westeberhardia cardiocondylae]|nr:Sec translocon subunit SecE [Candidatus Westeberhardia cardiocondylae]
MKVNNEVSNKSFFYEVLKWFCIFLSMVVVFFFVYFCFGFNLFLKCVCVTLFCIFFGIIFLNTKLGKLSVSFLRTAFFEMYKIVWPDKQEVLKTTFVIIFSTIVVSLILFVLDAILVRCVSFIISFKF